MIDCNIMVNGIECLKQSVYIDSSLCIIILFSWNNIYMRVDRTFPEQWKLPKNPPVAIVALFLSGDGIIRVVKKG
jgi:hypothetical protein